MHLNTRNEIKIHCVASRQTVINYLEENKSENQLLQYLLRNYQDLLSQKSFTLDIQKIKNALKQSKKILLEKLEKLQSHNILKLDTVHHDTQLYGLVPREDNYSLNPMLNKVAILNNIKTKKIEQMIAFAKDEKQCKRKLILSYFGEVKKETCGQCSVNECKDQQINTSIESLILSTLKDAPKTISELKQIINIEPEHLTAALYQLQEDEQIIRLPNQGFGLNI